MTENEPIKIVSDGITFLSTGRYYDGINRWVAHKLKDGDNDAIDYAARQIAKLLPQNAVLVPIPGHHGKTEQTMQLAKAISSYTHLPIVEALRGIERDSQYDAKKRGQTLSAEDMGFYKYKDLPSNRTPYLIDNVVDTGNTAKAAIRALGCGTVTSFAMNDTLLQREETRSLRR